MWSLGVKKVKFPSIIALFTLKSEILKILEKSLTSLAIVSNVLQVIYHCVGKWNLLEPLKNVSIIL